MSPAPDTPDGPGTPAHAPRGAAGRPWEVRAVHVDCGRKYLSAAWFVRLIETMGRVGLNELQLHLSDNEGLRFPSSRHPEVVSREHLSRADLSLVRATAQDHGVRLVPALDVPGHLGQVLAAHPGLRAGEEKEGEHLLDYSRPEGRALVRELIEDLYELVPATAWCLGGDEAFDVCRQEPLAGRFPRLAAFARERVGEDAGVMDGYVAYLGEVAAFLHELGVPDVRAWSDALYQPGTTQHLDPSVTVCYWTAWHPSYPSLERVVAAGHQVINYDDASLYYVLAGPDHPYGRRPTPASVRGWEPTRFPRLPDGSSQDPTGRPDWLRGASLSLWCDEPDREDAEAVWAGLRGPLEAFGGVMAA